MSDLIVLMYHSLYASDRELAFSLGRFLTMLRPEHYLALTLRTITELRVAFLAAVRVVQPAFPVKPELAAVVDQYVRVLRGALGPQGHAALAHTVGRYLAAATEIDLHKWQQAVELTPQRRQIQREPRASRHLLEHSHSANSLCCAYLIFPCFSLQEL